jgi:hypothetical protein
MDEDQPDNLVLRILRSLEIKLDIVHRELQALTSRNIDQRLACSIYGPRQRAAYK